MYFIKTKKIKIVIYSAKKRYQSGGISEIVSISLPIVISQSCETIMTFTDRLFLSRLDSEQMNAAMAGGITSFLYTTFFFGLIGFSTALVAQYVGASQRNKSAIVTSQSFIIAIISLPIILLLQPLALKYFETMNLTDKQLEYQVAYFNIIIFSIVISLFRHSLSCFFSGIGRTRIIMVAAVVSMCVNIIVNYILIYGKFGFPALEIRGAAIGTIVASISGVSVLASVYFGKSINRKYKVFKSFIFDKEIMFKLLRFGYPGGLEMFLNVLAFSAMIMLFHAHSEASAIAATIVFNWDMVTFVPLVGIEIGVMSLVGKYMGRKDIALAEKSAISGVKVGSVYSLFCMILFLAIPYILVDVFAPDIITPQYEEARPLAAIMLRIASVYVIAEALMMALIGALRGAGDTLWTMRTAVAVHWILVVVLYLMLNIFKMDVINTWSVVVGIFFIFIFLFYLRFKSGKWKTISVI